MAYCDYKINLWVSLSTLDGSTIIIKTAQEILKAAIKHLNRLDDVQKELRYWIS